jgi:membrane-associated HD superfamily phosphohydrolase
MAQAPRNERRTEASEAVAARPQLSRQLFEAQSEFVKSLSEIDRSLMDRHQEAQQKAWAAYAQYAQSLQANAGKEDALNEAFKTYSAAVQEIQSGFQQQWKELAEQGVKQKSNSYREFIRKVQTAWRQLAVEQLTPGEAAMVGQSLVSLATLSQMFAHFE